jgi:hypothetical protein
MSRRFLASSASTTSKRTKSGELMAEGARLEMPQT